MTIALQIAGCLLLLTVLVAGESNPEYKAECAVWQNISDTLMYEEKVPMNCQTNEWCTGIDCTSEFNYDGPFTVGSSFTVDFCFGVAIYPCKTPLEMNFYVETPDHPEDIYQRRITNGTQFQLPGVHYSLSQFGTADGFVDVTMNETYINGNRYVRIGLSYKTRISAAFGLIQNWPSELAFKLIPDTLVPVPPCLSSVVTPTHNPGSCVKYTPPTPTPYKPGSPTLPPSVPGSNCTVADASSCPNHETCKVSNNNKTGQCVCTPGYYRVNGNCVVHPNTGPQIPAKSCVPNQMNNCGQHQMCLPDSTNKDGGKCVCMKDSSWDGTACVTSATTPSVRIIGEPDFSQDGEGSNKSKIIIPVAVVAVVVIMGIAALVVVIKYRRYKARYGQHTLLMSEDDDDRVDNDDAMVEA